MHAAFELIEWLEPHTDPVAASKHDPLLDLFDAATTPTEPLPHDPAVRDTLKACLAKPEIQALFTEPKTPCTVWRERAFSIVAGDQFTNGVFDRVVIYQDAKQHITRAEIIDFKTDRIHTNNSIEQATEQHRPQLEAYRDSLSKIIGLNASAIDLKLLFTDVCELVTL